ncbi:556_t:CDS:2 [Ambispora gerdemannii]|uniref:556_t:CDS:1 n=1 Tax=Ambispora gerdemannii TaxID=144530 RepID=A0A9N9ASE8_9GLOM|nr:556_t:CDS:2 [Ambispora gerdemannii]
MSQAKTPNDSEEHLPSIPPPPYEEEALTPSTAYNNTNNSNINIAHDQERIVLPTPSADLAHLPIPSAPLAEDLLFEQEQEPLPPRSPPSQQTNIQNAQSEAMQGMQLATKPEKSDEHSYCKLLANKYNWLSLFWLILINFPISIFAIVWIFTTFTVSLILIMIPPLGYISMIGSIWTWRAIASFELIMIRVFDPKPKIERPSLPPIIIKRQPSQSFVGHYLSLLFDRYTAKLILYYLLKPWVAGFLVLLSIGLFSLGCACLMLPFFMNTFGKLAMFGACMFETTLCQKKENKEQMNEVV